jgi:hypothetical protein
MAVGPYAVRLLNTAATISAIVAITLTALTWKALPHRTKSVHLAE